MPAPSSAALSRARNARATCHCSSGSVFTASRISTRSGSHLLDAPDLGVVRDHRTELGTRTRPRSPRRRITSVARPMSESYATGMSSTTRAHCWLLLPTRRISPFGMCHTIPSVSRRRVVRRLTPSTVPGRDAGVDHVADAVLVLDQHEDAGEEVAHEGLGAEAERDPDDADADPDRREVDADLVEHHHAGRRPDEHAQRCCAAPRRSSRPAARGARSEPATCRAAPDPVFLRMREMRSPVSSRGQVAHDAPHDDAADPHEDVRDEEDHQDAQRAREVVADLGGALAPGHVVDGRAQPRLACPARRTPRSARPRVSGRYEPRGPERAA